MSGLAMGDGAQAAVLAFLGALAIYLCLIAFVRAIRVSPALLRRRFWSVSWRFRPEHHLGFDLTDVGQQLNAVMASSFQKRRILSPSEYRVFKIIEEEMTTAGKGYRVLAQTCLGEILHSRDDAAFRAINSKRVDILVVDRGGWPVLAIEYHGSGHYQGTAAARDAVKKEALRKAGVRYIEVSATDSDAQIRFQAREQLGFNLIAVTNCGDFNQTPSPVLRLR